MDRFRSRADFGVNSKCANFAPSTSGRSLLHGQICSSAFWALSISALVKGMHMAAAGQQGTRAGVPARTGQPGGTAPPEKGGLLKMPPRRTWIWFLALLASNFVLLRVLKPGGEQSITVPYTLFKEEVQKENVASIYSRGDTLTGRFRNDVTYPAPGEKVPPNVTTSREPSRTAKSFATTLPAFVDQGLEKFLIDHHVEISARPIEEERSPIATLIYGFGPALLLIGLYVWMFRRAAKSGGGIGGLMGFGQSKARRYDLTTDTKVTFDDVAGIDEAEKELVAIVDFLLRPAKY